MGICGHSNTIYLASILIQTGKLQVIVVAIPQLAHQKFVPHCSLLRGVPATEHFLQRLKETALNIDSTIRLEIRDSLSFS